MGLSKEQWEIVNSQEPMGFKDTVRHPILAIMKASIGHVTFTAPDIAGVPSTIPSEAEEQIAPLVQDTPGAVMIGDAVLSSSIPPHIQEAVREAGQDAADLRAGRITLDDLRAYDQATHPELF